MTLDAPIFVFLLSLRLNSRENLLPAFGWLQYIWSFTIEKEYPKETNFKENKKLNYASQRKVHE